LLEARKRISAIKQYSTLGSGFRIAMRDLEIRGAGNLLGAEQSGHIAAVGFELYCQLLKQSVSRLKGEKTKPRIEALLRLDFLDPPKARESGRPPVPRKSAGAGEDIQVPREIGTWATEETPAAEEPKSFPTAAATFPVAYISQAQHRIDIHRKLAQATDDAALRELKNELRDRFGPLPASAELLLKVSELKLLAAEKGVTLIETKGDKLMLTRRNDYLMMNGKFPRFTRTTPSARLGEIKRMLLSLSD
jgi:transcription-repair coupling factor (superfamily II helicase)